MAFLLHSIDGSAKIPGIEYLPAGEITPKVGMALVQSSGNLVAASGDATPTYISMVEKSAACTAGDIIPVIRITSDMIFETSFSASGTVNLGGFVQIKSDGLQVTATAATNHGAEVVWKAASAASGVKCRVRFTR